MELYTPEQIFNNPNLLPFKMIDPYGLLLLEYKREELSKGGILLIGVTANSPGQSHRLPKWKVISTGEKVEEEIGVKTGDFVIMHPKSGKPHFLTGKVECRKIKASDVLAKIIYEPKDYFVSKPLDQKLNWSKI